MNWVYAMTSMHECHVVLSIPDICIIWVGTNWHAAVETAEEFGQYATEIQTWIGSERTTRYRNVQNEWVEI